jgi:hypothetical protein
MPRGGIVLDAMRIINTTPKHLSIPKFCSKKMFIRGVVTFDRFGQKKNCLCNFSRIGKLHNEHKSFLDACFGILRGHASFLLQREQKDTENRGRLTFTNISFFEPIFGSNGLKNMNFD